MVTHESSTLFPQAVLHRKLHVTSLQIVSASLIVTVNTQITSYLTPCSFYFKTEKKEETVVSIVVFS